ncbi:hypothetical protein Hanom_Chr05g00413981 [Helianthus anomalus]
MLSLSRDEHGVSTENQQKWVLVPKPKGSVWRVEILNTTDFVDRNREVLASNKSPIIIVDILKTLFFILVWYTFSILLTLYNKKLWGDDQGKFPAPLLMDTIHFGMQAVFSKAIVYFWSERFKPTRTMSWKDYFMRGKNLAKSWLL